LLFADFDLLLIDGNFVGEETPKIRTIRLQQTKTSCGEGDWQF
jgi:hypothetical protein